VTSQDTSAEAAAIQRTAWQTLTPQERVEIAARISEAMMEIARAGIRDRHPSFDEKAVTRELLRRLGYAEFLG
jgi:predicted Fe-S protein YdhL (DUF1289 family)